MRLAYLPTWMVDFYGTYIDKYTLRPMDPMGFGICCGSHCWSVIFWNMLCFLMGIGVIQSACCKKHWKVSGGKTLRKSFGELFLEVLARWSGNVTPAVLPRKRTIPHPSSQILQWRCLYVLILLLYIYIRIYTYSVLYHDFENHRHIYLHKIFDVAFFRHPSVVEKNSPTDHHDMIPCDYRIDRFAKIWKELCLWPSWVLMLDQGLMYGPNEFGAYQNMGQNQKRRMKFLLGCILRDMSKCEKQDFFLAFGQQLKFSFWGKMREDCMLVVRVLDRLLDEVLYNTFNPMILCIWCICCTTPWIPGCWRVASYATAGYGSS